MRRRRTRHPRPKKRIRRFDLGDDSAVAIAAIGCADQPGEGK